jgi:hypothetical protein
MKKDAKLTFDHFLLLAQLGRAPPEWMILLLLEEAPDFIASDMSLVVSTVDEVLEYPIDDPPFYQPSILEKHFKAVKEKERLGKEKDSSDTSEAEREAASGSGAAEGSAQASASTSTDSGANADAATPGVNAFGISEGSWPPIPTMAHLEMLQDMDEDDDASHTTSDVESAMQIRLEAEEERQRAGRSTTEPAARERAKDRLKEDDDPEELVALFAGNVRKFKEKEADRRALATWRWTRAFAALLKKVHNDYSVKRALAREDMETSGKSIRTRHSGFKKWLVKFIERYQTESNTFRLRVMEQKRALIDSTELTGENPVEALRDLPWLLEDIKKRHREQTASDYSSANYPWSGRGDSELQRAPRGPSARNSIGPPVRLTIRRRWAACGATRRMRTMRITSRKMGGMGSRGNSESARRRRYCFIPRSVPSRRRVRSAIILMRRASTPYMHESQSVSIHQLLCSVHRLAVS